MHDVIIAGAGPIGSYIAGRLAAMGHRVLVLEKRSRVGESLCTGIVGLECVNAFNIDNRVIIRKANSARLISPGGTELHVRREETQACILDRSAFDIGMAERAQQAGAEYEFNTTAMNMTASGNNALVQVSRGGQEDKIPARAVVIATGFAPGLIKRLGFGNYRYYAVGAQAEIEVRDADEVEVYFGEVAPDFFGWIVPTSPQVARVGLLSRSKPGHYLKKWLAEITAQGRISSPEVEIKYGAVPLHPLSRTTGERLLLVGDAAGQVKPITGGGIYYGLLSAEIAVSTVQQALAENDLSGARLSQYDRGWRKKLGLELQRGYQFRKLYEHLSDRQVDRLFRIARSVGIEEALFKAKNVYFDWHGRTLFSLLKYRLITKPWNVVRHHSGPTN
jgi:digeranylgeranylglycerophospholipid reductase